MSHGGQVWQGAGPSAWLDFSANVRPEGPPDWVACAMSGAMAEVAYYPDVAMVRERAALARFLSLPVDCVLPTAGGIEAIGLAMRAVNGDVRINQPTFSEYSAAAMRATPSTAHAVPLPQEGGRVICNPNNPTGAALTRADLLGMEGPLIVDEAFIHCCPEGSVAREVERRENLIVLGSLTKSLGIPGVRLGYLCAHPAVMARLEPLQAPWALNCFAAAVLRALPAHMEALAEDAARNRARREALSDELARLGVHVYPSEACFLLVRLDEQVAPIAAALKQRGILVRECMDFPGLDDGRHLRLAVKTEAQNALLMAALEAVL